MPAFAQRTPSTRGETNLDFNPSGAAASGLSQAPYSPYGGFGLDFVSPEQIAVTGATVPSLSGLPPADTSSTVRWQEGTPSSDKFFSGGLLVKTIASNGLVVSASLKDTGWKMRADIMVTNKTDQRIDVVPDMLKLDVIVPKAKSLSYQDPEELAKSIDRRTRWANAFSGMAAGLANQTATSQSSTSGSVNVYDSSGDTAHGTYSGTTTTTTTSPDHAARQRAWEQQRINSQNATSTIDYLNSIVLRRNTLMPGQNVSGAVFFSREKNHDEVVLRVPVGNTVFEFPFRWLKK